MLARFLWASSRLDHKVPLTSTFVRSPNGIRTRVATLREWPDHRTRPLTSGFTAKEGSSGVCAGESKRKSVGKMLARPDATSGSSDRRERAVKSEPWMAAQRFHDGRMVAPPPVPGWLRVPRRRTAETDTGYPSVSGTGCHPPRRPFYASTESTASTVSSGTHGPDVLYL